LLRKLKQAGITRQALIFVGEVLNREGFEKAGFTIKILRIPIGKKMGRKIAIITINRTA